MKKSKIIGLSLCALMALTGCSCNKEKDNSVKANINNGETELMSGLKEDVDSVTLEEIYNNLKAESGNSVAANKLLEIIADIVLSDATWQSRYEEKIEEKLLALVENTAYQIDGEFNEELLSLLKTKKLRLIAHTHPDYGFIEPSADDRDFLKYIEQRKSIIVSYITGYEMEFTSNIFDDFMEGGN